MRDGAWNAPYNAEDAVLQEGKFRDVVRARSLLCYWAVRELGESMSSMPRRLNISTVAVSKSVIRGAEIARSEGFELVKVKKLRASPYPTYPIRIHTVPEQLLDGLYVKIVLEQMARIAVPKAMCADPLADSGFLHSRSDGGLHMGFM